MLASHGPMLHRIRQLSQGRAGCVHTSVMLAGRYRLEGRIAPGGVGELWRATGMVPGRPVEVKLRKQLAGRTSRNIWRQGSGSCPEEE